MLPSLVALSDNIQLKPPAKPELQQYSVLYKYTYGKPDDSSSVVPMNSTEEVKKVFDACEHLRKVEFFTVVYEFWARGEVHQTVEKIAEAYGTEQDADLPLHLFGLQSELQTVVDAFKPITAADDVKPITVRGSRLTNAESRKVKKLMGPILYKATRNMACIKEACDATPRQYQTNAIQRLLENGDSSVEFSSGEVTFTLIWIASASGDVARHHIGMVKENERNPQQFFFPTVPTARELDEFARRQPTPSIPLYRLIHMPKDATKYTDSALHKYQLDTLFKFSSPISVGDTVIDLEGNYRSYNSREMNFLLHKIKADTNTLYGLYLMYKSGDTAPTQIICKTVDVSKAIEFANSQMSDEKYTLITAVPKDLEPLPELGSKEDLLAQLDRTWAPPFVKLHADSDGRWFLQEDNLTATPRDPNGAVARSALYDYTKFVWGSMFISAYACQATEVDTSEGLTRQFIITQQAWENDIRDSLKSIQFGNSTFFIELTEEELAAEHDDMLDDNGSDGDSADRYSKTESLIHLTKAETTTNLTNIEVEPRSTPSPWVFEFGPRSDKERETSRILVSRVRSGKTSFVTVTGHNQRLQNLKNTVVERSGRAVRNPMLPESVTLNVPTIRGLSLPLMLPFLQKLQNDNGGMLNDMYWDGLFAHHLNAIADVMVARMLGNHDMKLYESQFVFFESSIEDMEASGQNIEYESTDRKFPWNEEDRRYLASESEFPMGLVPGTYYMLGSYNGWRILEITGTLESREESSTAYIMYMLNKDSTPPLDKLTIQSDEFACAFATYVQPRYSEEDKSIFEKHGLSVDIDYFDLEQP